MKKTSSLLLVVGVFCACTKMEPTVNSHDVVMNTFPEPESTGAQLLKQYCSACHGAPHPNTHTAKEWPNVVLRMNNRRIIRALGEIKREDLEQLTAYLSEHAK
ncbi:MAG: cytochrome c [Gammaproteobacteria bacterium]|nr:cytochrome c [Gammaproteobacteria bacterium]